MDLQNLQLTMLQDILSEKEYERKKVLRNLYLLNDEIKRVQKQIDDYSYEQKKLDFEIGYLSNLKGDLTNAN